MASLLKERAVLTPRQLIFAALSGSLTLCAPACAGRPRFPGSALGSWTSPVPCVYVLALLAPSLRAARSRPNSHAHSLSLTSSARAPLLVSTSWCPLLQASMSKLLHLSILSRWVTEETGRKRAPAQSIWTGEHPSLSQVFLTMIPDLPCMFFWCSDPSQRRNGSHTSYTCHDWWI